MFAHEGTGRSDRNNRIVAGYLALTGGYVNAAGFVLLGTFTSHVTGNVGRLGNDVATRDAPAFWGALAMIGAFFAGAVVASIILESAVFRARPYAYATALGLEAALLALFCVIASETTQAAPHLHDAEAALLCGAMGLQNALVTRLSGAIVRTTHLTGVITDIGIETARWLRWGRARLARKIHVPLVVTEPERPAVAKIQLLGTIASAFTLGAVLGATATPAWRHRALLVPIGGLVLAAAYALSTGRRAPAA